MGSGITPTEGFNGGVGLGFAPGFGDTGQLHLSINPNLRGGLPANVNELDVYAFLAYIKGPIDLRLSGYFRQGWTTVPDKGESSLDGEKGETRAFGGGLSFHARVIENLGIGAGVDFGARTFLSGKWDIGGAFPYEMTGDQTYTEVSPTIGIRAYLGPVDIDLAYRFVLPVSKFSVDGENPGDPPHSVESGWSHGVILRVGLRIGDFFKGDE